VTVRLSMDRYVYSWLCTYEWVQFHWCRRPGQESRQAVRRASCR